MKAARPVTSRSVITCAKAVVASALSTSLVVLSVLAATTSGNPAAAQTAPASDTLPSGVVVKHTAVGTGESPKASDKVKVHYRGTLTNGTEFDSSYKRNSPATFPLGGVVPCWTQGIQKMKVGGKATLTCPAATAYGERGYPPVIPPNSVLMFDVELLAIEK